ncbi:LPXTG-motif cell wall-anchored protein [Melghiribacillus thermohalophilus]|uniref:LPXTG-motif cell wall-anchored protein n=1 Tax=Melghiribacillus thermohalophilus TaxID=1324956 RepID=A0A4R3N6Q3_9BACI|nr:leucine-rich repeat protein [Melghiribacillus thermohalophilus]TCT24938.1 LPXTG-motif cell wall-anchored protein [Melghiribacillus thermohalophilus]
MEKPASLRIAIIALIALAIILMLQYPQMEQADADGTYTWTDNGDGTVTITDYSGTDTDIVIPDELDGKPVTEIGNDAFRYMGITSVVIPETVTKIGEQAFAYNSLTEITIPPNLTDIGLGAFHDNSLTDVHLPDSITNIGVIAFGMNNLTEVTLPNNETTVGGHAFSANSLTRIIIPNPNITLGEGVFEDQIEDGEVPINSEDIIIYGFEGSDAADYADGYFHPFVPLDSSPDVSILFNETDVGGQTVSVDYQSAEELKAVYHHEIASITDVIWTVNDETIPGDSLSLEPYTTTVGETTIRLTVETEYGGQTSKEVIIDVQPPPLPASPELTVESRTETDISLQWGFVPYADEYILKRDGEEIYRGTGLSYEDRHLSPGTSYTYTVHAVNMSGTGEGSTITAETEKSSNTRLKDLTISGVPDLDFDPEQDEYQIRVAHDVEYVTITPSMEDEGATVIVQGDEIDKGDSIKVFLDEGKDHTIEIQVVAQDGTEQNYTLNVTRLSSDILVKPTLDEQMYTVKNEDVFLLGQAGTFLIDLTHVTDDVAAIYLSKEQLAYLIEQGAVIQVQREDVILNIPSVNVDANQDLIISLRRLNENVEDMSSLNLSRSAVYTFQLKQGEEFVREFSEPVELQFAVSASEKDVEHLNIYYWNDRTKEWELIGGRYNEGFIQALTDHFSTFTVFDSTELMASNDQDDDQGETETAENKDRQSSGILPETGTQMYQWLIGGLLFIIAGTFFILRRPSYKNQ